MSFGDIEAIEKREDKEGMPQKEFKGVLGLIQEDSKEGREESPESKD